MWEYLKKAKKPIVLYGMGNNADRILDKLYEYGIEVSGVFASDDFVRGHSFRGHQVINYSAACERFGNMIILLCFGTQRADVMQRIVKIASEQELLVPDMPLRASRCLTLILREAMQGVLKVFTICLPMSNLKKCLKM